MTPKVNANTQETAWLQSAGEVERVRLDMKPDSLWVFAGFKMAPKPNGEERWRVRPGVYRLLGIAKDVRTLQEMAVHIGVGGKDNGLMFCCPLGSWATNFTPYIEPVEAAPMLELAAGLAAESRGSGN